MLQRNISIAITAFSLFTALPALSAGQSGYYRDSQKGWWWGERTVEEEPEQKEEKKVAPKKEEQEPWVPPPLSAYKYDDVWNMHPDQFYELQEAYKKKAVQDPSYENTKDYYELSEIARKKSSAFTSASQYVWQKHPELTVAKDYPIATPGNMSRVANISGERRAVLRKNQDKYALIFFWKPGCSYCEDQKKILSWFESQTGWIVKPVNILENPRAAAKVGVEITPTTILIKKGSKDHFPVSAGVISAEEVEDKTYRAVRLLNGEITPQEYSTYDFQKGGGFDPNSRKDWVPNK